MHNLIYKTDSQGVLVYSITLDAEYLVFVSSCSLKMREKYTNRDNLVCLSLYSF